MSERRRGNDGTSFQIERAPRVRQGLIDAIAPPEKYERKEPRIFNGPKPYRGTGCTGTWISDEMLLEIRRRRAWNAERPCDIATALGLRLATVLSALTYNNRGHIDPGPRPAP
jgi:hypothetical protein